ncbi:MAG: hypothetical protein E7222_08165 [Clostridiales bacterium]|nr:hypothetical protein [Clostridiales bacterium]
MYKELDKFLSEETTIDSWYDDGFSIAQDILSEFSEDDWEELSNCVLSKPLEWQKKLVYCLDNEIIDEELNIIIKLISVNDDELFEMCIDALRAFNNELGHNYLKANPDIIKMVENKIENSGNATKRVLEDFLGKFISHS